MPLRLLLRELTADQRAQVRRILLADRGSMRDTLKQLRDAHEALADRMFAAGDVKQADVDPLVRKIAALHQQLLEHGTKVMLQVRAIATPEQLAKAAATKQKLDQLHEDIEALLGEAGVDDDEPE
jgi:Spy/CpxP family protein refolding chaperone